MSMFTSEVSSYRLSEQMPHPKERKKGINSTRYIPYFPIEKIKTTHLDSERQNILGVSKGKESHWSSIILLEINQATATLLLLLLTLLARPCAEWVVVLARAEACLRRELRRGHAGILALQRLLLSALAEEWIVACL